MSEDLIRENNEYELIDHIYHVHGLDYFDFRYIRPEVDGTYEVLFDTSSIYRKLIKNRTMSPYMQYNSEGKFFYINEDSMFSIKDGVIGWRAIDVSDT